MKKAPGSDLFFPDQEEHFLQLRTDGRPFWEGYQVDRLKAAFPFVQRWNVAVDGGAHVGLFTRYLAERFARVYAFEPDPEAFACLIENTKHLPGVTCIQAALSQERGTLRLEENITDGNTGNRQIVAEGGRAVEALPLDDLELEDVNLIKLDLQGHEDAALKGAEKTVKAFAPVLIVEVELRGKLRHPVGKVGMVLKRLASWEAREIRQVGDDHILHFPEGASPYAKYRDRGDYHWQLYSAGKTKTLVDQVVAQVREICTAWGYQDLLDVGCGDGLYTSLLGAFGVDNCAEALRCAREHGADCASCDVYRLHELQRRFDAALVFDTLEHLHWPELALRRLGQVTDVLLVLNPEPDGSRWHVREFRHDELEQFLRERGWDVLDRYTMPLEKCLLHAVKR